MLSKVKTRSEIPFPYNFVVALSQVQTAVAAFFRPQCMKEIASISYPSFLCGLSMPPSLSFSFILQPSPWFYPIILQNQP
jgi:hypothetical protein